MIIASNIQTLFGKKHIKTVLLLYSMIWCQTKINQHLNEYAGLLPNVVTKFFSFLLQ